MEFDNPSAYVPGNDTADESLPIFNVERVQLQFSRPSEFVAAQVANNAIVLAFTTGRILRIGTVMPVLENTLSRLEADCKDRLGECR
jgi:hypothetical protein